MDHVVTLALPHEVTADGEAEAERRDEQSPALSVEGAGRETDDLDSRKCRRVICRPLNRRDVGDVVAGFSEPHGKVAQPALGTADRVWVQTVVDETHSHWPGT